jgi:hypothetical protein
MLHSESLTPSRGCLVQVNGGGWKPFNTSAKAALHVAKNLINGRRAQVSFRPLNDTSNEQIAFAKEVESVMRGFGDARFVTTSNGLSATTYYSAGSYLV